MAKKKAVPYKKGGTVTKKAPPAPVARQKMVKPKMPKKKSKLPTLGAGLTGLGGTGAQGMMP